MPPFWVCRLRPYEWNGPLDRSGAGTPVRAPAHGGSAAEYRVTGFSGACHRAMLEWSWVMRKTPRNRRTVARRPFADAREVVVVPPREVAGLGSNDNRAVSEFRALLHRERAELEVELGAPVRFADADPGAGPRWLIGPASNNPDISQYRQPLGRAAGIWFRAEEQLLIADGPGLSAVQEALSLLRTLVMTGEAEVLATDCTDLDEAIDRMITEVGWTYPAFGLRNLDWEAICAHHRERVAATTEPLVAAQKWLAELGDAHTWVRALPVSVPLPYQVWVEERTATLTRVAPGTAASQAGVRVGDTLAEVDAAGWWARTGAPAHSRPLITGYRLLSSPVGVERALTARRRDGTTRTWFEAAALDPPYPLVQWRRLQTGTGYLRIEAWRADRGIDNAIDAAFSDLFSTKNLIVDLRGNVGGNLVLALSFRDRFLRRRTRMGSIRFSTGPGGMSPPAAIVGEPAEERYRWHGNVCFLTDPLTYSASEDALLGLQGLPHVRVVGESTGGGSGRPRTLRLLPGWRLTISTALTYDRLGRCIENVGIMVDRRVTPDRFSPDAPDHVLLAADRSW